MEGGVIGRDAEVARVVEHIRGHAAGPVVVSGPPGIGKTTLVRAIGDELVDDGWAVEYPRGVPAGRGFPFAPFVHLLEGAAVATETEQIARLRATLTGGDRRRLLVVDDAHLLDAALPLLEREATNERRREAGKTMRSITAQMRVESAREAVARALETCGEPQT